jgi:hypothetical protein
VFWLRGVTAATSALIGLFIMGGFGAAIKQTNQVGKIRDRIPYDTRIENSFVIFMKPNTGCLSGKKLVINMEEWI